MTNDITSKDSIKIKMDTYTRQLYEDFISALSDRLRETANNSLSKLTEIYQSLDALRDHVKEPDEVILKKFDDLVNQLNNIVQEHDNKFLFDISQIMEAHKSNLQTSINSGQSQTVTFFNTLDTQIGNLVNEFETKHDNLIHSLDQNLDTMKDQLKIDLESVVKDNSESITNRVNEYILSKNEILTDSLDSNIQSVLSVIEELQNGLLSELAKGNERLDNRVSKIVSIASIQMRRIRFAEHLIYKALKTSIDSFFEYKGSTEDKLSSIESNNLEQKDISNQSLELIKLINSEILWLKTYVGGSDHDSISDLLNSSISEARGQIEVLLNRISQVIETYYPELKDFVTQKNQDLSDRIIGEVAKLSEAHSDKILEAISTSETIQTKRTIMACKDVIDKVDALTTMLSDRHNELVQTLNGLHQELISGHKDLIDKVEASSTMLSDYHSELVQTLNSLHQDLNDKNDELAEQLITNQELLIWILTPWYKKIFRRKNGRPQVLAKKPVVESENN